MLFCSALIQNELLEFHLCCLAFQLNSHVVRTRHTSDVELVFVLFVPCFACLLDLLVVSVLFHTCLFFISCLVVTPMLHIVFTMDLEGSDLIFSPEARLAGISY